MSKVKQEIASLQSRIEILKEEIKRKDALIKTSQRKIGLFELLAEEMREVVVPLSPLPPIKILKDKKKHTEDVVMHLSDEHMDEVVDPKSVQGFECYNFDIARIRAETYVERVLNITQNTLSNYVFPNLWILAYGDHTSGEIHKVMDHSAYRNIFRNCFAISQVHALMIRDLAPYFENINIIYLSGNHGRRTPKKDYHGPWDNWDYMIGQTTMLLTREIPNLQFQIPNAFSITVEIAKHVFAIEHGDDIRSWNTIPFYGIERKSRRLVALNAVKDRHINYFVYGHFHTPSSLGDLSNNETIINGSWMATNPYTFNSLSGYTEPMQWLHGVHPEHGITWRYKINLRTPDEQKRTPRYQVNLA